MGSIDETIPLSFIWGVQTNLLMMGSVIIICITIPWILVPLLAAAFVSYYGIVLILPTLLKIVKLEANSMPNIYFLLSFICKMFVSF